MTGFDYVVLCIIGFSVLLSIMRGFIREILALVSWVAAFIVAKLYTMQLAPLLPDAIPNEAFRFLAAFIILFLVTLLICSLLAIALSHVFKSMGLTWMDRMLGAVFGVVRGVAIVATLIFLAGFTNLPKDARWRSAMFSAPLEAMVLSAMPWFSQDIAQHVKYD